jgi:hypothetical protein
LASPPSSRTGLEQAGSMLEMLRMIGAHEPSKLSMTLN